MSEAKATIERIAAAIQEKNEAAFVVEGLMLVGAFFSGIERIADALEAIANNTAPNINEQCVTDGDIGFAVAAMKGMCTGAGAAAEIIDEAIKRLEQ